MIDTSLDYDQTQALNYLILIFNTRKSRQDFLSDYHELCEDTYQNCQVLLPTNYNDFLKLGGLTNDVY